MAEFCSVCALHYGLEPDIDIQLIALELKPGEQEPVLCEGCELIAIGKKVTGEIELVYRDTKSKKREGERFTFRT